MRSIITLLHLFQFELKLSKVDLKFTKYYLKLCKIKFQHVKSN